MNILQVKELEDLKEQKEILQEKATGLFKSNVLPLIKKRANELMDSFQEYFSSNGFEISRTEKNIKATYKQSSFGASLEDDFVSISKDGEVVEGVRINCARSGGYSMSLPNDKFRAEKAKINKEIEELEKDIQNYTNPEVYYATSGRKNFNSPKEVLKEIFE